jgi:hypothetical protein
MKLAIHFRLLVKLKMCSPTADRIICVQSLPLYLQILQMILLKHKSYKALFNQPLFTSFSKTPNQYNKFL